MSQDFARIGSATMFGVNSQQLLQLWGLVQQGHQLVEVLLQQLAGQGAVWHSTVGSTSSTSRNSGGGGGSRRFVGSPDKLVSVRRLFLGDSAKVLPKLAAAAVAQRLLDSGYASAEEADAALQAHLTRATLSEATAPLEAAARHAAGWRNQVCAEVPVSATGLATAGGSVPVQHSDAVVAALQDLQRVLLARVRLLEAVEQLGQLEECVGLEGSSGSSTRCLAMAFAGPHFGGGSRHKLQLTDM